MKSLFLVRNNKRYMKTYDVLIDRTSGGEEGSLLPKNSGTMDFIV